MRKLPRILAWYRWPNWAAARLHGNAGRVHLGCPGLERGPLITQLEDDPVATRSGQVFVRGRIR